jgi:hypothetical protein
LKNSNRQASYFSFCDQDDIWYLDKIERAIKALDKIEENSPALYCSAVEYVDDSGGYIKKSESPRKLSFENALVENVITGCTIVLNKRAKELILTRIPDKCIMHDSWCYLVLTCFGQIIFDDEVSLKYRQHSNNVFGAATSRFDLLIRRIKRLLGQKDFGFHAQASNFLHLFESEIPERNYRLIKTFVFSKNSLWQRLILLFDSKITRQRLFDSIYLKLLIILNKY